MTRLGELRSLVPAGVGMMALTATATRTLRISILGMSNPTVIAVSTCKAKIMYAMESYESLELSMDPFVRRIRAERTKMPHLIIYCRSYSDCADLYLFFREKLGSSFTEPPDAPDIS